MPVRRLEAHEQNARRTDFELTLDRVPSQNQTYIGYLYPTEVREKWIGFIKLYGQAYNISAEIEADSMHDLRLRIEFLSDKWLAHGGEQFMYFYHRVGRTYGGDLEVPIELRPDESPSVVKVSFSYRNPAHTRLKGRREFSWRISQRGLRA